MQNSECRQNSTRTPEVKTLRLSPRSIATYVVCILNSEFCICRVRMPARQASILRTPRFSNLIWHHDVPQPHPGASMTTPAATINIGELLANSRVGPLQKRVFILCALCLIIDGFDVQAMGYVAPALVPDWKIDRSALGPVF